MSDDLISRQAAIDILLKKLIQNGDMYLAADAPKWVESLPTAFDKEKVHRELIELRNAEICRPDSMNKYDGAWSQGRYSAFLDAIRIVEKGGIE